MSEGKIMIAGKDVADRNDPNRPGLQVQRVFLIDRGAG